MLGFCPHLIRRPSAGLSAHAGPFAELTPAHLPAADDIRPDPLTSAVSHQHPPTSPFPHLPTSQPRAPNVRQADGGGQRRVCHILHHDGRQRPRPSGRPRHPSTGPVVCVVVLLLLSLHSPSLARLTPHRCRLMQHATASLTASPGPRFRASRWLFCCAFSITSAHHITSTNLLQIPPCPSWFLPFIGHTGIASSAGVTYDFAGPYTINASPWRRPA